MESAEITSPLPIGHLLKQARESKGVTLSEAATATYLLEKHLVALENENWLELPESTYVRGYLRSYARYLNLDVQELMTRYDDIISQDTRSDAADPLSMRTTSSPMSEFKHSPKSTERQIWRRLIWVFLLMLFAFVAIGGVLTLLKYSPWESVFIPDTTEQEKVAPLNAPELATPVAPDVIANKIDSIIFPAQSAQPAVNAPPVPTPAPAATTSTVTKPTTAQLLLAQPLPAPQKPVQAKTDQIEVVLGRQSLVTVFDKFGNVLFSGVETPEKKIRIAGQSPFTVVIPRAEGVKVKLNNIAVDPSSKIKAGSLEIRLAP